MIVVALMATMPMMAQKQYQYYLDYIEQWKETAVQQQAEYGIPASITLAQGLLESSAGQSELAVNAKNHFGIKCTNEWFGAVYYYDDDSKGECFRQYSDAIESFRDHSLFLLRPRYATCFEIAPEDYEGWAYRLKECGYATDRFYAQKLIKIIEDYRLDTLAVGPMSAAKPLNDEPKALNDTTKLLNDTVVAAPVVEKPAKRPLKATVVHRSDPIMVIHNDPEPPYVEPKSAREERDSFLLSHPKHRQNGLVYVMAREGDTYANVAFRLNVRERELREDNDALGRELKSGDRIYLSPKKRMGNKDYVWTFTGQSLWQLSQDEGVTVETIQRLNDLDPRIRVFRTRQKIYLRKVKEENGFR